ncbi:hypothetical protein [Geomonas limicola]|nr:hypothetical protein [Geomonas limicola]
MTRVSARENYGYRDSARYLGMLRVFGHQPEARSMPGLGWRL